MVIHPPDYLDDVALSFWGRHVDGLARAGVLHEQDLDSFALLCQTWSRLQHEKDTKLWLGIHSKYGQLARQFYLTPLERQRRGVSFDDPTEADLEEFGVR